MRVCNRDFSPSSAVNSPCSRANALSWGRGRDASDPAPPAQIPACGTTAPGSCLGSNAQAQRACRTCPTPVSGFPGPVSGPCGAQPGSPQPAPCSPPPPLVLAHQSRCARASSILWGCPTPCTRPSRAYPLRVPRADLATPRQAKCRASRVPRNVFPCLPGVSDPAGSVDTSP
jgi:hypothetical protein